MNAKDAKDFCRLLKAKNLSVSQAAKIAMTTPRTITRYRTGETPVSPQAVALIQMSERQPTKRPAGYSGVWIKDRPKPKAKRNGRKA